MKVTQDEFHILLERSGLALYGERWKSSIADDLGVSYRTLQNWLNRTYAAKPDEVMPKLLVLLQQREQQTANLIADINRGINS
ncbi:MAG: hypothetical protein CL472_04420 [Acidobacteria bacterium]|nr:hypothetical protein [Acidobacteriota bacterium]|tara:strand:- start:89 stop:337 length:249 start_codon:yes stop_codon:yes gene_type:complete